MHHPDYQDSSRYDPSSLGFCERTARFYRTTREAYGTSWYVEKPNKDWLWMAGAVVMLGAFFLIGYYTA